jgi:putative transposase
LLKAISAGGTRPPGGVDRGMAQYPGRLSHLTPGWVKAGAIFHVRIRIASESPLPLTDPSLAALLLESARFYHEQKRWNCPLLLLMPDHLHALLQFSVEHDINEIVGAWKRYHAKQSGIHWQTNFFNHRIRSDNELGEKAAYIRRNPVVKGLSIEEEAWPFSVLR